MLLMMRLQDRLDKLYTSHDELAKTAPNNGKISDLEKEIRQTEQRLNQIREDETVFKDWNLNELINNITSFLEIDHQQQKQELIKQLTYIQLVFKGREQGIEMDLSSKQITLFDFIKTKVEQLIYSKKERVLSLKDQEHKLDQIAGTIFEIDDLREKISDSRSMEPLTGTELELVYEQLIKGDLPYTEKKEILLEIQQYNNNLKKNEKKEVIQVDIEEVKELFRSCGFDEKMEALIDRNQKEISVNGNLQNMKNVLEYLMLHDRAQNKRNILTKFDLPTLLTIATYGTPNSVRKRYESINLQENYKLGVLYETASVWCNNLSNNRKQPGRNKKDEKVKGNNKLLNASKEISYDDMLRAMQFLEDHDFNVDFNRRRMKVILQTPYQKLLENYEIYKMYQIYSDNNLLVKKATPLSFSNVAQKCDKFIELDLQHYIRNSPTAIQATTKQVMAVLQIEHSKNSKYEFRNLVESKTRAHSLASDVTKNHLGHSVGVDPTEYLKRYGFIDLTDPSYLPNAKQYEEIVNSDKRIRYDSSIFEDENVMYLEENYKTNELTYDIGGNTVSRLKVLRVMDILNTSGQEMGEDKVMYALTYNSTMTENKFDKIADEVNYQPPKKEVNNGLSTSL